MFGLANLLTATNLCCGIVSIIFTLSGRLDLAACFLLFSVLADFADGFVARITKTSGELGKQLDSLADMVSFGVAPGIFMMVMIILGVDYSAVIDLKLTNSVADTQKYFVFNQIMAWFASLSYDVNNSFNASIKFLPFTALMIPFFSMFRLAKFNIDTNQSDKFIGVPTPLSTLFFLFFPLYFWYQKENWGHQNDFIYGLFDCYTLSAISVLFSTLMIAPLPLIALKFKSWGWRENTYRYLLVIISLISIPIFFVWSIPIIVILYLILSIIEHNQRKKHEIQS
jgi:CDP-diacylglycerol--serine O-phosphatidyltransferase